MLPLLRADGLRVTAHTASDPAANLGVNTRADLAAYVTGANLVVDGGSALINAQVDPMLRRFTGVAPTSY